MSRRSGYPLYGNRFCDNKSKKEVHDLDNEDKNPSGCQIDEIIASKHVRIFNPDSLEQARKEGYDNCAKCIGGSKR